MFQLVEPSSVPFGVVQVEGGVLVGDGAALEALRSFHSQELTLGLAASAPSTSSGVGEEGAWALSDLPAGEPTETATTSS